MGDNSRNTVREEVRTCVEYGARRGAVFPMSGTMVRGPRLDKLPAKPDDMLTDGCRSELRLQLSTSSPLKGWYIRCSADL